MVEGVEKQNWLQDLAQVGRAQQTCGGAWGRPRLRGTIARALLGGGD
jgi:hypothetical protein